MRVKENEFDELQYSNSDEYYNAVSKLSDEIKILSRIDRSYNDEIYKLTGLLMARQRYIILGNLFKKTGITMNSILNVKYGKKFRKCVVTQMHVYDCGKIGMCLYQLLKNGKLGSQLKYVDAHNMDIHPTGDVYSM